MIWCIISNRCLNRSLNNSRCNRWLMVISLLGSIIVNWCSSIWNRVRHYFLFFTYNFNIISVIIIFCGNYFIILSCCIWSNYFNIIKDLFIKAQWNLRNRCNIWCRGNNGNRLCHRNRCNVYCRCNNCNRFGQSFSHWSSGQVCCSHFESFSIRNIIDSLENSISINITISTLDNTIRCLEFLLCRIGCGITIIVST